MKKILLITVFFLQVFYLYAENGYRLWLRYDKTDDAKLLSQYQKEITGIQFNNTSATLDVAKKELLQGLQGLLNKTIADQSLITNGTLIVGTSLSSPQIKRYFSDKEMNDLGDEGFIIQTSTIDSKKVIFIVAKNDVGVLYGVFHFLRLIQTHQSIHN